MPFVADVHAGFALAGGFDDRTVHLDGGLVEELIVLLFPNVQANLVEGILETIDVIRLEPATEVSGSGRIGNPLGPDGIEKELIIATQFDVLQASATAQRVVGKVQNVIGFVIRQVFFEQMQCVVDPIWQSDLLGECMNGSHTTVRGATCFLCQLVRRVGTLDHWCRRDRRRRIVLTVDECVVCVVESNLL